MQTASSRYEVRLEDLHRDMGHLKEAAWVIAGVLMDTRDHHVDPIGRWVVHVIDRRSGAIVVENRWGHDHDTAKLDLQYVGRGLDSMAVDVFEQEYGIQQAGPPTET